MESLVALKIEPKLKLRLLSSLGLLTLLLSTLGITNANALDSRVIDVVQVTWRGASEPAGTLFDVRNEIETDVKPRWRELTSVLGDAIEKRIEFNYGQSVSNPINLTTPLPCERVVTAWGDVVREQAYKKLGITDSSSRYLVILAPENGCIWSGVALTSRASESGGTLILHNTTKGFVIAHELGHLLGLGHSNLIKCPANAADGSWVSCKAIEYGGAIDLMSNVDVATPLSTYHQWRMGLLGQSEVIQSWASETVELSAVDVAGKPRALFIRDGGSTYWIEFRRANGRQKAGLVIYRTDPPPGSAIVSPNPADALQGFSSAVGADIWMMNLDNYSYLNSQASGSPALPDGKTLVLASGGVNLTPTITGENSVSIAIDRSRARFENRPVLESSQNWVSPESLIIDSRYLNQINGVAEYWALIDGREVMLNTQLSEEWEPTYLDPFTQPKLLRQKDLPEGEYSLSIRVKDLTGRFSPWSEVVKVRIDRGYPIFGNSISIENYSFSSTGIRFLEMRDEGSNLCSTQLVNEEGWVVSRSTEKVRPTVSLPSRNIGARTLKAFDCLGNGVAREVKGSIIFTKGSEIRTRGQWSSAGKDFPAGSIRCVKSCSAYLLTRGAVGVVLGTGSAQVQIGSGSKSWVEANKVGSNYRAFAGNTGNVRKTIRITGKGFVLLGVAQSRVTFGEIRKIERFPITEDLSLEDSAQRTLSQYGFSSEDFSFDWRVVPIGRGTTLEDPTLDLCSGVFESELGRVERRQVMALRTGSPYLFLSSETVRYRSKAAGEAAIKELKEKWSECKKNSGGIESSGAFQKYSFLALPESNAVLVPESNRLVVHAEIGEGDSLRNLFAIYQYSGELFTGLYVVRNGNDPFSDDEILRWFDVGAVLAERLQDKVSGA